MDVTSDPSKSCLVEGGATLQLTRVKEQVRGQEMANVSTGDMETDWLGRGGERSDRGLVLFLSG